MTTRRDIITNGLGLAAIIAAGKAPAALVRSMSAARQAARNNDVELQYIERISLDTTHNRAICITPIYGSWRVGFRFRFSATYESSSGHLIFGARSSYNSNAYFINYSNELNGGIGWGSAYGTYASSIDDIHLVEFDAITKKARIDDLSILCQVDFVTPYRITLFGCNEQANGRTIRYHGRLVFTDDRGVATHIYIPVIHHGEVCYREDISGEYLYPTGGFLTAGPSL